MGGCCCCSYKGGAELRGPVEYPYYPRASDEHIPLSTHQHGAASTLSQGLLVDTNLETSTIDTYRPPPLPVPYDADIRHPRTPPAAQGVSGNKGSSAAQTANSESEITAASETLESMLRREELLESEDKDSPDTNLVAAKNPQTDLSKSAELFALPVEEEDVCPICLEEYDKENPKITTKCEHNFHLSCIFEWMERSDTCAVCAQEMIFSPPIDV